MSIADDIVAFLKKEYSDGATYQEMSTRHKVSLQHIRGLCLGENPPGKMHLDTFGKMFPRAKIIIDPASPEVQSEPTPEAESIAPQFDAIIESVMTSELDAAAKVKLYEIIHQIQKKQERRAARNRPGEYPESDTTQQVEPLPPDHEQNPAQITVDFDQAISQLDKKVKPAEDTVTPRGKPDGMTIFDHRLRCPGCQSMFFVPKLRLKKKIGCPFCGQHIVIS